jgi:hypothetical protein
VNFMSLLFFLDCILYILSVRDTSTGQRHWILIVPCFLQYGQSKVQHASQPCHMSGLSTKQQHHSAVKLQYHTWNCHEELISLYSKAETSRLNTTHTHMASDTSAHMVIKLLKEGCSNVVLSYIHEERLFYRHASPNII